MKYMDRFDCASATWLAKSDIYVAPCGADPVYLLQPADVMTAQYFVCTWLRWEHMLTYRCDAHEPVQTWSRNILCSR